MSWTFHTRLVGLAVVSACGFQASTTGTDNVVIDSSVDVYIPDAGPCQTLTASCIGAGSTLRACTTIGQEPVDTQCSWGCLDDGGAHCGKLQPSGGVVTSADLDPSSQLLPAALAGGNTIDTMTGEITGVRPAGAGIAMGIEFSVRGKVGVFRFNKLTIDGANVLVKGPNALALVSITDISIGATLDLQGACMASDAGPGGGAGGAANQDGSGSGHGSKGGDVPLNPGKCVGGGGGANGGDGGRGGNLLNFDNGGNRFGNDTITALAGGGGGGGGNNGGGAGGGGGGAVQLVANDRVTITGGIQAGGCGGKKGAECGGGAGGGGTILIEAPVIAFNNSKLAVNGGGGAGGNDGNSGEAASLSNQRANGGSGGQGGTNKGGNGGDGGDDGQLGGASGSVNDRSGAGGGGVGRMRFNTLSGGVVLMGGYMFSPSISTTGTTTTVTKGTATVH